MQLVTKRRDFFNTRDLRIDAARAQARSWAEGIGGEGLLRPGDYQFTHCWVTISGGNKTLNVPKTYKRQIALLTLASAVSICGAIDSRQLWQGARGGAGSSCTSERTELLAGHITAVAASKWCNWFSVVYCLWSRQHV